MMAEMAETSGPEDGIQVTSALPDTDLRRVRRARIFRRLAITLLGAFVLLGMSGVFGARSGTASASAGGYFIEVTYPARTRPGLAVRWSVEVSRSGGLGNELVLATSSAYFDLFDFNQLYPQPAEESSDSRITIWTFDTPDAETMRITLDGRLEPARQNGADAITSILVDGEPIVSVRYRTRVMP